MSLCTNRLIFSSCRSLLITRGNDITQREKNSILFFDAINFFMRESRCRNARRVRVTSSPLCLKIERVGEVRWPIHCRLLTKTYYHKKLYETRPNGFPMIGDKFKRETSGAKGERIVKFH